MREKNSNKRLPHLAGLTLILIIGLVAVSVGITYARYRDERRADITLQVREPDKILIGTIDTLEVENEDGEIAAAEIFTASEQLAWSVEDGIACLQFTVANGSSETDYSARNQIIQLSMIGSLGLMQDGVLPTLSVTFSSQKGDGEEITVQVSSIEEGSALYHSYGAGWQYRFYESTAEGTQELTWELAGGEWSYITLTMELTGEISESVNLLQPLISAESIDK